jgi:hypothetical protein
MVDERITDGKRVAQLLASELSGLEAGPLAAVDVADADPDAEPSPEGTTAYRVTVGGEPAGRVVIYPERAVLRWEDESVTASDEPLTVDSGAAVKRAVDAVRDRLRGAADG